MSFRKVHHVNIVAHARAVPCRIIVAENVQPFQLAHGHLSDVRNEVVRDSVRIFPDKSRRMRADRVEVSQKRDVEACVRLIQILQNVLYHQFGLPVRVCAGQRKILGDRHRRRVAVNGGRAGKHDVFNAEFPHKFQKIHGGIEVVSVVFQRFSYAFADRFKSREVYHVRKLFFFENAPKRGFICHIDLVKRRFRSRDLLDSVQNGFLAVGKIVHDHHVETVFLKFNDGVAADVTATAGHQNSFHIDFEISFKYAANSLPIVSFLSANSTFAFS